MIVKIAYCQTKKLDKEGTRVKWLTMWFSALRVHVTDVLTHLASDCQTLTHVYYSNVVARPIRSKTCLPHLRIYPRHSLSAGNLRA